MKIAKRMTVLALSLLTLAMLLYGLGYRHVKHEPTAAERFGCSKTYINAKGEDTGECE